MVKKPKTAYEKIRKPTAPKTIWHKDDSDYHRKSKHRNRNAITLSLEEDINDENDVLKGQSCRAS